MRIRLGISALAAVVALSATTAGAAPITWDLTSGGCSTSGSSDGNTRTCSGNQGGSPTVTASAWANTGGASNTLIQNALLESFSGGLGVRNRDRASGQGDTGETSSPEHSMDNDGRYDSLQFAFSSAVQLTGVEVGWWDEDSDITVLAYTGAGTPTLANNTYGSLLGAGWTLIGHYANVDDGWETINGGGVSSKYWLFGAYNPLIPGADFSTGNDYVKIESLKGNGPQGQNLVPEPATMALFGAGLLGLAARRRAARRA